MSSHSILISCHGTAADSKMLGQLANATVICIDVAETGSVFRMGAHAGVRVSGVKLSLTQGGVKTNVDTG